MTAGRKIDYYFAVYTPEDEIVTVMETYKELAMFLGKTYRSLQSTISRINNGKTREVLDNTGKKYKIYMIKR